MLKTTGTYDDALERFHRTGPEFDGYLTNHGPMVVEVLARRNQDPLIDRWTDRYLRRLDELPRGSWPVDPLHWQDALGDLTRTADWIELLQREVDQHPWRDVLARWWPRLLPGIAAGATHGVIRVGHAVRALGEVESAPRIAELAQALGYWAARWQATPAIPPVGTRSPTDLVAVVPRVAIQQAGIRDRLAQLDDTLGWADQVATLAAPATDEAIPAAIESIVDAVVAMYPLYAQGSPTMLVHAATAPNAVAMTLSSLPKPLWRSTFDATWSVSAAVIAAYAPVKPHDTVPAPGTPQDVLEQALAHGGEHVIKFTDTALASHRRTGNRVALTASATAVTLDA
jgi:Questin oxidase-like